MSLLGNLGDLLGDLPDRGWSCPPPEVLPRPDLGPMDAVGTHPPAPLAAEPGRALLGADRARPTWSSWITFDSDERPRRA